jgi:hypothetical protein
LQKNQSFAASLQIFYCIRREEQIALYQKKNEHKLHCSTQIF